MFLVRPSAYKDESAVGFLLRIANRNGYPNISNLLRAIGYRGFGIPSTNSRVWCFESLQMEGIDVPDEFMCMEVPRRHSNYGELLKEQLPLTCFRTDCSAVCPECLSEAAYIRSVWGYQVYTTCHRHGLVLISQCLACGEDLGWKRASIELCQCGFDLRQAARVVGDVESAVMIWKWVKSANVEAIKDMSTSLDACSRAHGETKNPCHLEEFKQWIFDDDAGLARRMRDLAVTRLDVLHPRLTLLTFLRRKGRMRNCALTALSTLNGLQMPKRSIAATTDQLTRDETMLALGINSHHVLGQLNRRRLINQQPVSTDMRKGVYEVSAVDRLLRRLWIPSLEDRRKPAPSGIHLHETVLHALADSESSKGYDMAAGLTSLRTIQVSPPPPKHELKMLRISDVARALGVHVEVVRSLIQREYLPATIGTPKYPSVVSPDDLRRFREEYVFASTLAKQAGSSPTRFAEKLYASGIGPAGGPTVDGLKVYIFRREKFEAHQLEAIAKLKGVPISGMRSRFAKEYRDRLLKKVITLEQAARELRVTTREVSALVRKGFLTRALAPDLRVMINVVDFEPFRDKFTDPKMMSLADAAAGCGETIQQFVSRWVKKGVVKPENMGIRVLVPRADYNKVQNLRQSRVAVAESERLLGKGRSAPTGQAKRNVLSSELLGDLNQLWLFHRSRVGPVSQKRTKASEERENVISRQSE